MEVLVVVVIVVVMMMGVVAEVLMGRGSNYGWDVRWVGPSDFQGRL
jgi:hypothetical protein